MPLAVANTLAIPAVLVTAVAGGDSMALGPEDGAVNVTMAPLTGLPSRTTVTCSGTPNGVLAKVVCGEPPVTLRLTPDVTPNRMLVVPPVGNPLEKLAVTMSALPSPLKSATARAKGEAAV